MLYYEDIKLKRRKRGCQDQCKQIYRVSRQGASFGRANRRLAKYSRIWQVMCDSAVIYNGLQNTGIQTLEQQSLPTLNFSIIRASVLIITSIIQDKCAPQRLSAIKEQQILIEKTILHYMSINASSAYTLGLWRTSLP